MSDLVRVVAVVALLGAAAAIATPKGRLPLALRGLKRVLGKSGGDVEVKPVSVVRRFAAFLLVLAAAAISLLRI